MKKKINGVIINELDKIEYRLVISSINIFKNCGKIILEIQNKDDFVKFQMKIGENYHISYIYHYLRSIGVCDTSIEYIMQDEHDDFIYYYRNCSNILKKKIKNQILFFIGIPSFFPDRNFLDACLDILQSKKIIFSSIQIIFEHFQRFISGKDNNEIFFKVSVKFFLLDKNSENLDFIIQGLTSLANSYSLKVKKTNLFSKFFPRTNSHIYKRDIKNSTLMNGKSLAIYITPPQKNYSGLLIEKRMESKFHSPPDSVSGIIPIGYPIIEGRISQNPFLLSIKDLFQHVGVWGRTGTGKTRIVYQIINTLMREGYKICIFDVKGEYFPLLRNHNISYFKPKSKEYFFELNPFHAPEYVDKADHFVFLYETFRMIIKAGGDEITGQMEELLERAIKETIKSDQNFEFFIDLLTNQAVSLGVKGSYIEKSGQAIASRVKRITRGAGEFILLSKENSINFKQLKTQNTLFDFSPIFKNTGEGFKFISEIIFHLIVNTMMNLNNPISNVNEVKNIFVFEETQLLAPFRKIGDQISIFGRAASTLRSYGGRLIFIGTTPNVESSISDNIALNIFLDIPKYLDGKERNDRIKRQNAVIILPNWPPFLIKIIDVIF